MGLAGPPGWQFDCSEDRSGKEMGYLRQTRTGRRQAVIRTVLIVDDEAPIRESLNRYLQGVGYVVMEAADFDKALSTLEDMSVDAMVLDIRLPGRSGFELLERVRGEARLAGLPVLVLTGYFPNAEEQALINRLGASVFYKPEGCVTVLRHLERLMRT
jgi:DNA-binding response OmpR family regulator